MGIQYFGGYKISCDTERVVSLARLSLAPRESQASETTECGEDGKWALCMHTTCVHIHTHTHISMSGMDSRSLLRRRVLSDTPTDCVTQCANVPSLKWTADTMQTMHYEQDMCMKPNVIPLTPQGHFVPQLYHKAARDVSSLKTSCLLCNHLILSTFRHVVMSSL